MYCNSYLSKVFIEFAKQQEAEDGNKEDSK